MEKISSPFIGNRSFPKKDFTETDYIHYMEVEEVADGFDNKKPSEFLIEKHIEEYERIPIEEFINSFASKVGLKNELKGIISKQQMDAYIESHKAKPGFTDLTKLPDSQFEMEQLVSKIDGIWDSIPSDLKGSLSKEEFLKTLTTDKLRQYVLDEVKKTLPKDEVKGEE